MFVSMRQAVPTLRPGACSGAVLACLLCLTSLASAFAAEGAATYRVVLVADDDVLNIRKGPSASYPIVGTIPPDGRGVRRAGSCRGWCRVSYDGVSGWVNGAYLAPEWTPGQGAEGREALAPAHRRKRAALPGYWQVTGVAEGQSLRVHEGPSASASVVHAFAPHSACIRLAGGCQKPWCRVTFRGAHGAQVGWVDSNHLAPSHAACGN
jgi:uncharacterized protein YraI